MNKEVINQMLIDIDTYVAQYEKDKKRTFQFTEKSTRAIINLFIDSTMCEIWELQSDEGIDANDSNAMILEFKKDLSNIFSKYTNFKLGN